MRLAVTGRFVVLFFAEVAFALAAAAFLVFFFNFFGGIYGWTASLNLKQNHGTTDVRKSSGRVPVVVVVHLHRSLHRASGLRQGLDVLCRRLLGVHGLDVLRVLCTGAPPVLESTAPRTARPHRTRLKMCSAAHVGFCVTMLTFIGGTVAAGLCPQDSFCYFVGFRIYACWMLLGCCACVVHTFRDWARHYEDNYVSRVHLV